MGRSGDKPRVYILDREEIGYAERFVFAYLSWKAHRKVLHIPSFTHLCFDIEAPPSSVRDIIDSLESKGLLQIERRSSRNGRTIKAITIKPPRGERLTTVPLHFLYSGSMKERGLLLTLVNRARPQRRGQKTFYYYGFHLSDLALNDAKDGRTLRRMLRALEKEYAINIEQTKPYYLVRVLV